MCSPSQGILQKSYLPAPASKCLGKCLVFLAHRICRYLNFTPEMVSATGGAGVIAQAGKLQGFCSITSCTLPSPGVSPPALPFLTAAAGITPSEDVAICYLQLPGTRDGKPLRLPLSHMSLPGTRCHAARRHQPPPRGRRRACCRFCLAEGC